MSIRSSAHIGKIIRDGVAFDPKNWGGAGQSSESITKSVEDFFSLLELHAVDYVVVGGIAQLYYFVGRNTQDINLIMSLGSLKHIPELVISQSDSNFARGKFGELSVDILSTKNPLFNRVRKKYASIKKLLDRDLRIATVDGLLLLKLYALPSLYRQGDFARIGIYENDISTLLYAYPTETQNLIKELGKYVDPPDLAEIKQLLNEIQNQITRFVQRAER